MGAFADKKIEAATRVLEQELDPSDDWKDYEDETPLYHQGVPFTGIAFELYRGAAMKETQFVCGLPDGIDREWDGNGNLVSEASFRRGIHHGVSRMYCPNGRVKNERLWELASDLRYAEWDDEQHIVSETELRSDCPFYELIILTKGSCTQLLKHRLARRQRADYSWGTSQQTQRNTGTYGNVLSTATNIVTPPVFVKGAMSKFDDNEVEATFRVVRQGLVVNEDGMALHNGSPFTGFAYDTPDDGAHSEVQMAGGLQDGLTREWDRDGNLRLEESYREGILHGLSRRYYPDGAAMSEELIELEVTLRRTEWDHEGRMTKTVEIAADNPEYSLLLSRRSFCVNDAQEDEAEGLRFWL